MGRAFGVLEPAWMTEGCWLRLKTNASLLFSCLECYFMNSICSGCLFVLVLAAWDHRRHGRHGAVRAVAFLRGRCVFLRLFCHLVVVHLSFGHRSSCVGLGMGPLGAMVRHKPAGSAWVSGAWPACTRDSTTLYQRSWRASCWAAQRSAAGYPFLAPGKAARGGRLPLVFRKTSPAAPETPARPVWTRAPARHCGGGNGQTGQ